MRVQYRGTSDIRVIGESDMAKVGVEGFTKRDFSKLRPTEVSDEAGLALTTNDLFKGEFIEVVAEPEPEPEVEVEPAPPKPSKTKS